MPLILKQGTLVTQDLKAITQKRNYFRGRIYSSQVGKGKLPNKHRAN